MSEDEEEEEEDDESELELLPLRRVGWVFVSTALGFSTVERTNGFMETGEKDKLLTYLMKEKQEIENQDIKKVPVVHMNSPLGFAGFLTELSCPLTSCSLLSSSLLFSRVSSSLDLPTLPFFPAVHEKMTKDVTDLESTWRCSACSVQGHIETKSGIEANSAEPRGRNKSAEYFLRLHLTDISH